MPIPGPALDPELRAPAARHVDAARPDAALADLCAAQLAAAGTVAQALPALAAAASHAARALGGEGRLIYAGAGSAGLMALADALELPGTFGIPPDRAPVLFAGAPATLARMTGGVEDDAGAGAADLARLAPGPADVVLCVSASGRTPYTLAVAEAARAAGATVVAIANTPRSPLLAAADVAILLETGPERVAGSTRMGAGTAQKIALNLISTMMAVELGHVRDGHMVNLVADNAKLRRRAARIVAEVAGVPEPVAQSALAGARGAVKPAILVAAGAAPDAAAALRLLAETKGHLAPPLARLSRA